jgi:hypothetical protein
MPDQHSAATEHELISTVTEPLGQLPQDPLGTVPVDFPVALRGYDRIAVDAYVEHTTQLIAELQSTRSPEAAVRRALERVGEEISGILQRAHDTADEITARSRAEAEERLETARREGGELTAEAERRVAELDAETDRIWAERHSIVTDVRDLASRLTGLAEEALDRFPPASPAAVALTPAPAHPFDGAVEVADPEEPSDGESEAADVNEPLDGESEAVDVEEPLDGESEAVDVKEPLHGESEAADVEEPPAEEPVLDALLALAPDPDPTEPTIAIDRAGVDQAPGADHVGVEHPFAADHAGVDQPTAEMPPIEPWEGEEPGPFDPTRP